MTRSAASPHDSRLPATACFTCCPPRAGLLTSANRSIVSQTAPDMLLAGRAPPLDGSYRPPQGITVKGNVAVTRELRSHLLRQRAVKVQVSSGCLCTQGWTSLLGLGVHISAGIVIVRYLNLVLRGTVHARQSARKRERGLATGCE